MVDRDRAYEDAENQFSGGPGIGADANGKIDSFPLSELAQRERERDSDDAATAYAVEQSEQGFPDEDEIDVEEMDKIATEVGGE